MTHCTTEPQAQARGINPKRQDGGINLPVHQPFASSRRPTLIHVDAGDGAEYTNGPTSKVHPCVFIPLSHSHRNAAEDPARLNPRRAPTSSLPGVTGRPEQLFSPHLVNVAHHLRPPPHDVLIDLDAGKVLPLITPR